MKIQRWKHRYHMSGTDCILICPFFGLVVGEGLQGAACFAYRLELGHFGEFSESTGYLNFKFSQLLSFSVGIGYFRMFLFPNYRHRRKAESQRRVDKKNEKKNKELYF